MDLYERRKEAGDAVTDSKVSDCTMSQDLLASLLSENVQETVFLWDFQVNRVLAAHTRFLTSRMVEW